jgi:DNA polymerase-3 subunit delta
MAKSKPHISSVTEAIKKIRQGKLLPIYYFFGEDSYSMNHALTVLQNAVKPFLVSEFDNETFYGEDTSASQIVQFASSFPFGSEKKLIVCKEFEKVKDKQALIPYIESPAEFSVVALLHQGKISNLTAEPYALLQKNNFIFEAKELKGESLIKWLIDYAESNNKLLSAENAQLLAEISGENRSMLESQLEKIFTFIGSKNEITYDIIKELSTALKEYTIFDLQNSLAVQNKAEALKIAFNLLDNGSEMTYIVHMLTRFFTGLLRVNEMNEKKLPDAAAAKFVGTHPYYYRQYREARKIFSDEKIYRAAQALLKADFSVKTTSADHKTILTILITEILN